MDTGAKQRLALLQQDAERHILGPLRTHGWVAAVERIVEAGEYLIISAERGGQQHSIGLLYTSATDNRIYKTLANQVEHIFFNGMAYMVESYAHGLDTPVAASDDFHSLLLKWNAASTDGKFVAGNLAVQQKRHHHPRVKRRLPKTTHIAARDLLQIKALPHQLNDKPRDMAFRHEVLHIRRQQQCLIDIPGAKILAHSSSLNQTRSKLNSDYSDRLLGD